VLNRAVPMDEAAAQRSLAAQRLVDAQEECGDLIEPENPVYRDLVAGHMQSSSALIPELRDRAAQYESYGD